MDMQLYTLLRHRRGGDLLAIADIRRPLGALPPIWALVNGLWLTAFGMILLLATAAHLDPRLAGPVWAALALLSILEGSAIEAAERRLRGWREVALVEARSPEGAEEQFLTAASPPEAAEGARPSPPPQAAQVAPVPHRLQPDSTPAALGAAIPTPATTDAAAPPPAAEPATRPPGLAAEADGPASLAASLRALADSPEPAARTTDTPPAPDSPAPSSEPTP